MSDVSKFPPIWVQESLEIEGEEANVRRAQRMVEEYSVLVEGGTRFENAEIEGFLRIISQDPDASLKGLAEAGRPRSFGKKSIAPKGLNQRLYVDAMERHDMVFGIGPSGTGKTYLAVAMAVDALLTKEVSRIILARPAVEAGERLGYLPGTLQEKVNPYLRPLYDALYDVLDPDRVERYLEKSIIEIAPIAFMRGRTLNDAFVILDEAQNTTSEQMKMFLTRLGFNSKAVVTGDVTQIDLPMGRRSGLVEAVEVVGKVTGISIIYFTERDVVRHSLVQRSHSRLRRVRAGPGGQGERRTEMKDRGPGVRGVALVNRQTRYTVRAAALADFLRRLKRRLRLGKRGFNVCLVDDRAIRQLNSVYRGRDEATDVLSFPWAEAPRGPSPQPTAEASTVMHAGGESAPPVWRGGICNFLGDVVISVEAAGRNAHAEGHATLNEIRWLILHGVLHLLGYDHERDEGQMVALELSLREQLGVAVGPPKKKPGKRQIAKVKRQ